MVAPKQPTGWVGWIYFAGMMLVVSSVFQAFMGIVALTHSSFYLVTGSTLSVYNFTTWGWIHLLLAVVLLFAGFSVLSGHLFGRIVATIVVALSIIANLIFLPAYPVWSVAVLVIDALVLYALVVHGNEVSE
jgi:hypothetical protein